MNEEMGSEVAPWCKSFVSYTCCPKVEESPAEFQKAGDPQHILKKMKKGQNIKNMEGVDKITEDDIGCAASSFPPSKKKEAVHACVNCDNNENCHGELTQVAKKRITRGIFHDKWECKCVEKKSTGN